ncbi:DUF1206 domain-containing protein [Microbacterium sp. NPDC055357]
MPSAPAVKSAAREAASNPVLRFLARAGYVANGIVHVLIGAIVLAIAFGAPGEGDQAGALKALASAPLGFILLWVIAVALAALGVWHAFAGIIARAPRDDVKGAAKKWARRVSEWGQAVVFLTLGVITAAVALGARPDAEKTAESASRGVLQLPGGPFVLGLTGLGIAIGGIAFIVMGLLRSFRKRMDLPDGKRGRGLTVAGIVGFIAKGVSLGVVGVLVLVAAVRQDADAAGGLDGAIDALLELYLGPLLAGLVGAGFVVYGVFTVFRARYARLDG